MTKFLVILDVDSTLIENEVIELLADFAGVRPLVEAITTRAMNGEIDFSASLRERVAALRGLPITVFDAVAEAIVVTRGVTELVSVIHASGGAVGAVSGGFHEILDPLGKRLGLDFWRANRLEVYDGTLTGRVDGPVVDAAAKAATLVEWSIATGIPMSQTVAVGDGSNDLDMMAVAGIGVGFDPKPTVRHKADAVINERDLSQLLAIMGLRG
jgi:phosphoserine phosphatase